MDFTKQHRFCQNSNNSLLQLQLIVDISSNFLKSYASLQSSKFQFGNVILRHVTQNPLRIKIVDNQTFLHSKSS